MSATFGSDISTPEARRASLWHLSLIDHGFLRRYWTNLYEIAPGVWRSNQPSPTRLRQWHRELGLKSVFNLRGKQSEAYWLFEEEVCRDTGIELVDFAAPAARAPTRAEIETMLNALTSLPSPVLIHCKSGADRTGLVASIYLAVVEMRPLPEVRRQLSIRHAHLDAGPKGVLDHIFRVYERDFAPLGISVGNWLTGPDYDPEAITSSYKAWNAKGRKGAF